jgi:AmmeMemoRadiSam system protein B
MIRPDKHAGLWYSNYDKEVRKQIQSFMEEASTKPLQSLKAIISPHAAYQYSGSTAGWAYKAIDVNQV